MAAQHDWESVARFVVGAFRADAARAGAVSEVAQLVDELCRLSPEFEALWRDNDVHAYGGAPSACIIRSWARSNWNIRPSLSMAVPTSA